jgi:hypothetical protein
MAYVFVILISIIAAYTELLSRYDDPLLILYKFPSLFYIILNSFTAVVVYYCIDSFGISVNINGTDNSEISQIILAGTSSLLLLRSSFGIFKMGDKNIEIGLSGILKIIFDFCDRKFDQIFTEKKLIKVKKIMDNEEYRIDFEKAKTDLPVLCMKMMTNLSIEESKLLGIEVADLDADCNKNILQFNKSKIIRLGFIISKFTGTKLLEVAVKTLKDDIIFKEGEKDEKVNLFEELLKVKSIIQST